MGAARAVEELQVAVHGRPIAGEAGDERRLVGEHLVEVEGVVALRPFDGTWEEQAVAALAEVLGGGRFKRLSLARSPDELRAHLTAAGFVPGPKGLVRYA